MHDLGKSTEALHADRDLELNNDIAPPIFQSVTQFAEDEEAFVRMASEPLDDQFYGRYGNRTASRLSQVIAKLEEAETGLLFGSGMGAISTTVLSLIAKGDHVVAQNNHYIGTTKLLKETLPRFGVEVTMVDQVDIEQFARAIRPNTKIIVLETPVNPLLSLTDLEQISSLAKPRGILTLCDNTFATPILQRPTQFDIDLVLHSVTKYIGGHHDLIAGCVVGSQELIERIWAMQLVLGSSPGAFNAWLALRGVRTLDMRVRKQCKTALALANHLNDHPAISRVYYPAMPTHPQYDLVQKQMQGQGGGLLTFELKGGYEAGVQLLQQLDLVQNAASLGGIDSLAIQPAVMWGGSLPPDVLEEQGISPGMIRLSVGLEDIADLIHDFNRALQDANQ
ncbi:MAG: aminotransferase class I/II-fold pyridoxal phosphate-dependent enzyme [Saprospiraceae bacterium]|nr:aminotransferase class I/II-fold pyridoxal phosphate-dependent enzyme [Saprospiraceae bacterium]